MGEERGVNGGGERREVGGGMAIYALDPSHEDTR